MGKRIFKEKFYKIAYKILSFVFPNYCINCGKMLIEKEHHCFCNECWDKIEIFNGESCKKCGAPVITAKGVCFKCRSKKFFYNEIKCVGKYDGILKEAIRAYKYENRFKLADEFVNLILDNIDKEYYSDIDYIIPVPASEERLSMYGFAHILYLAERLGKRTGIKVLDGIKKIKHTPPQVSLNYDERINNLKGAFLLKRNAYEKIEGKRILLIDDVYTTGTTVNEVSLAIKQGAPAKIKVLTIAKTWYD